MVHDAAQAKNFDPETRPAEARDLDPNVRQHKASSPDSSIWVNASAGTGKTKVLTDRVLRLLLPREDGSPGTDPRRILCLTFTRAGAGEMALRLNGVLAEWAVLPLEAPPGEKSLIESLRRLLGRAPRENETAAARRLFASVVDAPGGLQIMTIHSFCQSVLSRFPLEAGITPHFTALEEREAAQLLTRARQAVLLGARENPATPEGGAFTRVAAAVNEDQFSALLQNMGGERYQLERLFRRHWNADGLYTALCALLEVTPGESAGDILRAACRDEEFNRAGLADAALALADGTEKSDQPKAVLINDWLQGGPEDRAAGFEAYSLAFLTKEGAARKNLATKAVLNRNPAAGAALEQEACRLLACRERMARAECAALTRDLLLLGHAILGEYRRLKDQKGALDFDDMILKTLFLLGHEAEGGTGDALWVLYKLDQGLDHILVDEAQDTNPEQWQIIRALCDEFFAGEGARDGVVRSLFTVGDDKQSIYSFQRAAPEEFDRMQGHFAAQAKAAALRWDSVALNISFRSSAAVLSCVDAVFKGKNFGEAPVRHHSFRTGQAGLAELWPLCETEKAEETDPWAPPVEIVESRSGAALLAEKIGAAVKDWLERGEILPSRGAPIEPDDIMILVRRRTAFTGQLARALKTRGIPVSGSDRMVLNDQLPVQDLLALADFALLPEDNLSLACALKSPLLGWSEDDLAALAIGRRSESLWLILKQSVHKKTVTWLQDLIHRAAEDRPFEFFSRILQRPCPADPVSGWRAVKKRLGGEAVDPLDELLSAAIAFERDHPPSMQSFMHWQAGGHGDIKRELDEAGGQVRIMTVHGAKGLQAPIVFLPDTTRTGRGVPGQPARRLLWPQQSGLDLPLWSPGKETDFPLYKDVLQAFEDRQDEEYDRLLYVAMTRAEDRLYVAGYKTLKEPLEASWYHDVRRALEGMDGIERLEDGTLRTSLPQTRPPDRPRTAAGESGEVVPVPDWLFQRPPAEPDPPAPLVPSRPSDPEPAALSPLQAGNIYRFRRGNLTHKLLQFLPDLPQERWEEAATRFIRAYGSDLEPAVREGIVRETLAVLDHPEFAPLFGPGSMAEVPLTGLLPGGRLVSGQIDRLLVGTEEIRVIDYKTNRPPPADPQDVPAAYIKQMRAYADTLRALYPERRIRAALLWTDGPLLMPLDV